MAEFCKCGSIILSEKCSNKNCAFKVDKVPSAASAKKAAAGKTAAAKKTKTATTTRKNSKCVTYSIDELGDRDPKYRDDDQDSDNDGYRDDDDDEEKYEEDDDT